MSYKSKNMGIKLMKLALWKTSTYI